MGTNITLRLIIRYKLSSWTPDLDRLRVWKETVVTVVMRATKLLPAHAATRRKSVGTCHQPPFFTSH